MPGELPASKVSAKGSITLGLKAQYLATIAGAMMLSACVSQNPSVERASSGPLKTMIVGDTDGAALSARLGGMRSSTEVCDMIAAGAPEVFCPIGVHPHRDGDREANTRAAEAGQGNGNGNGGQGDGNGNGGQGNGDNNGLGNGDENSNPADNGSGNTDSSNPGRGH